jgi:hypothetical protein
MATGRVHPLQQPTYHDVSQEHCGSGTRPVIVEQRRLGLQSPVVSTSTLSQSSSQSQSALYSSSSTWIAATLDKHSLRSLPPAAGLFGNEQPSNLQSFRPGHVYGDQELVGTVDSLRKRPSRHSQESQIGTQFFQLALLDGLSLMPKRTCTVPTAASRRLF